MYGFSKATASACVTSDGKRVTYGNPDELAWLICEHMEPLRSVFCLCSNTVGSIAGYVAILRGDDAALMLLAAMKAKSYLSLFHHQLPAYY